MFQNRLNPGLVVIFIFSLLMFSAQTTAAETVASGTFNGASGHVTSGTVTLVNASGELQVVLGDDFNFDGAP